MRPLHLLLLSATLTLRAATYYVDSSAGNDSNPGTSQNTPWKSLEKVNATELHAGDGVLFQSGGRWQGQLVPRGSGSEGSPIVIGRYGSGSFPRIDADGKFSDAIRLYNVQFIEVRNLEVTNLGAEPAARRGVHLFLDNFGTAKHIVLAGLYVHDVNGSNGNGDNGKDNGGIIFRTMGDKTPSRFDGLTIERNIVWKVDRSAIAAESYHWKRTKWFPSLNVLIRDNFVDDIGGDGIVPWATDGAIVEHNIALHCNRRAGSHNAGIWPWSTDNSVFQLNEAAFTHTTWDGEGFDSDFNSRHTLFQYNYGHDNEGGFMLICTPGNLDQDNLGNIGTEVRYNISHNDHARIFHVSAASQTSVHDNAIYVGTGIDLQMLITTNWEGWANDAMFRNNDFYVEGTARYGHQVISNKDGTYLIGAGWGPAKEITFEGNHYYGENIDQPSDATGTHQSASAVPKLNFEEPAFDPVHPELFDAFLTQHREWMMRLFEQQFGKRPTLKGVELDPRQFALMAWGDSPSNPDGLQGMREAGLNISGFCHTADLNKVKAAGLTCFVNDSALSDLDPLKLPPDEEIRHRVSALDKEISGNPAAIGFFLRDEPSATMMPGLGKVATMARQAMPRLWPYVNLFPARVSPDRLGTSDYSSYVRMLVSALGQPFLSYDNYSLVNGEMLDYFYTNLEIVRRMGLETKTPFWNCILANSHFNYMEPSDATFNLQVYATLAYGGRGIQYFTYFAPMVGNYRLAAVDQFGNRTATWDMLRQINSQARALAPTLMGLHSTGVYHFPDVPEQAQPLANSKLLESIEMTQQLVRPPVAGRVLVGEFEDDSQRPYFMIVNKDLRNSFQFKVKLRQRDRKLFRVSPYSGEEEAFGREMDWLAPGAGILFRVE